MNISLEFSTAMNTQINLGLYPFQTYRSIEIAKARVNANSYNL